MRIFSSLQVESTCPNTARPYLMSHPKIRLRSGRVLELSGRCSACQQPHTISFPINDFVGDPEESPQPKISAKTVEIPVFWQVVLGDGIAYRWDVLPISPFPGMSRLFPDDDSIYVVDEVCCGCRVPAPGEIPFLGKTTDGILLICRVTHKSVQEVEETDWEVLRIE